MTATAQARRIGNPEYVHRLYVAAKAMVAALEEFEYEIDGFLMNENMSLESLSEAVRQYERRQDSRIARALKQRQKEARS